MLTLDDATNDLTLTAFDKTVAAANLTLINDAGIITVTSFDNVGTGSLTLTASSGGIVLNDGSIATSSGAVTLSASTTITDGDVTAGNADITATGLVSLTGATGVGATGAAAAIDIATATSLAIDTNESFNIVGATLTVTDKSITLNTTVGSTATYELTGVANTLLTLDDATNDLTLTAFDKTVAAANLTLINDAGIITVTSFDNVGTGTLTLTASSGGIVLNDGSIATSSGPGEQPRHRGRRHWVHADAVTLSASTTITDGDAGNGVADITATGLVSLTGLGGVGSNGAATAIDIATATSLLIDTNQDFNIVGASLTLTELTVTIDTGGTGVYELTGIDNFAETLVDDGSDLTVTNFDQSTAAANISLTNDTGNITVASFDNLLGGTITLVASSGNIILNDAAIVAVDGAVTITATAGTIAGDGSSAAAITTSGSGDVVLTASGDIGATGAAVDVSVGGTLTLTASGGDIFISSPSTIALSVGTITTSAGDDTVSVTVSGATGGGGGGT